MAQQPIYFATDADFRRWLQANHDTAPELLVGFWKKGTARPSIDWPQARDQALCFGWIDGVRKSLGDDSYTIRFTPRRRGSIWSKVNVDKVAKLIEGGRMQAPGLAQVEAAKANGRWGQAYDSPRVATEPEDLLAALNAEPKAKAFYATINAANRYAVLWRIQTAVKPETRARRIAQLVDMLARGETVHIFKPKPPVKG